MSKTHQQVSLYYSEGGSDKVYHAQIQEVDGGFVVNFQYGRRGSSLQCGSKTSTPVDFGKAQKVFDKVVAEKRGKGYVEDVSGSPYQGTANAGRVTGLVPQLLNPVGEPDLEALFIDPAWTMQEKMDGERRMASVGASGAAGSNRKGLAVPLPLATAAELSAMFVDADVDGEEIGDTFYLFDLLRDGSDMGRLGYVARHDRLRAVFAEAGKSLKHVVLVERADTEAEKRTLFADIRSRKGEGVVFKRKDAPYVPGRPNTAGDQLKFKFYATATVAVDAVNTDRRSVKIAVVDDNGCLVPVGNVTIPPSVPVPVAGSIIEVRYLYAYQGGSLYQPTFERSRPDVDFSNLEKVSSLKLKPDALAAA